MGIVKGENEDPLGKLEDMCKLVSHEGLGIRPLEISNRALLNKWLWRFGVKRTTVWRQLVATKYGEDQFRWTSGTPEGLEGAGFGRVFARGKRDSFIWSDL